MKIQKSPDTSPRLRYQQELVTNINTLNAINQASNLEANDLIWHFMSSMGNLFLLYYQWHLDEAQALAKEHKMILEQARPSFRSYRIELENFLMGTFEDCDEWDRVCTQRTNIEAINAMFEGAIDAIDIEDLEHCMQQRKEHVSISSESLIPPNMPKSHWWWWN
jgi:hypothetical protein